MSIASLQAWYIIVSFNLKGNHQNTTLWAVFFLLSTLTCYFTNMLISVCIKSTNESALKDWHVISVTEEQTLHDLYKSVVADMNHVELDLLCCTIGVSKMAQDDITADAIINEAVEFGRYLSFKVKVRVLPENVENMDTDNHDMIDGKPNAFVIMQQAQSKKCFHLPDPYEAPTRNKKMQMYNDILSLFRQKGLGFSETAVKNDGLQFIKVLTDTLWYLDPNRHKFTDRGYHFPSMFKEFQGYNIPQVSKHKQKPILKVTLMDYTHSLEALLDKCLWFSRPAWKEIKEAIADLADTMHKYIKYLEKQILTMQANHSAEIPVRDMADAQTLTLYHAHHIIKPTFAARYRDLTDHLKTVAYFEVIKLDEFAPDDLQHRRYYYDTMHQAMPCKAYHFRVAYGNNCGTYHFLWKVTPGMEASEIETNNVRITKEIVDELPHFHTRSMRQKFMKTCSMLTPSVKPAYLRHIYKGLVGDYTESMNEAQKEVDERVKQAFDMQDPDIVVDLRDHNCGQPEKYSFFFSKTKEYLESVVETAVDDRRHGTITHLATAISAPDLLRQVEKLCPAGTPIPSEQWLRLQFAPKNPTAISSLQHTGKLDIKYAIQSRQFRSQHEDDHYASAIFRYLKEFCVKFKDQCVLACADDKHHAKVGEPGNPVAAVERGKRVITMKGVKFVVSDHDFTRFSLVPSVCMLVDLPSRVDESFYRGQVYVGIKDLVFQPSSPLRHATELIYILENEGKDLPIMCLYTDGGPDHRCTYLSVQLSLVCIFLARDLDMLMAVRTPPRASWKNPPERVMSILNQGMQCVGLQRTPMEEQYENTIRSCNTLQSLRESADGDVDLKEAMKNSIRPVQDFLAEIYGRLYLKDKVFKTFPAATDAHQEQLWQILSRFGLENTEIKNQAQLQKAVNNCAPLKDFLAHCCTSKQYMFCVKKCGRDDCNMCSKPRLHPDVFKDLAILPDPVPADENHYRPFEELYGKTTTEEHRPSLKRKVDNGHQIPFSPSAQTANAVKRLVYCSECQKPRVLYARRKLSWTELRDLDKLLSLYEYSCGTVLQDLQTPNNSTPIINSLVTKVFARANLRCSTPIELPYFSSESFADICIFCATRTGLLAGENMKDFYPCCEECFQSKKEKDRPHRRKRNIWEAKRNAINKLKRNA